jgi:membrane-bound lytic murein transglycosylase F
MQKTKSRITRLAVLLMIIAVTAFSSSCARKNAKTADTADTTRNDSVLRVATLSQSVSYYEKDNTLMGYEYELATEFAQSQNKKIEFVLGKDMNDLEQMLEKGEVDLVAYPLIVTNEFKQKIKYTDHTYISRQVLVQRSKQEQKTAKKKSHKKWKKGSDSSTDAPLRDVTQLIGKKIYVVKGSKYAERLKNLNEEIGGGIKIIETNNQEDEEDLMDKVSNGEIDYTICDENIALANNTDYTNIDIKMPVSFAQRSAWAVKDTALLKDVNAWFAQKSTMKMAEKLYNKYFEVKHILPQFVTPKRNIHVAKIPQGTHEISLYDPYFKEGASITGWDWRWIAALAHQESKFNPNATSWSGARGLMQLVPGTAYKLGAKSKNEMMDPEINVKLACKYLRILSASFSNVQQEDRIKFVLASYNAGVGHVKDAQALAKKYGKNPNVWSGNVEEFVRLKSNAQYYNDPVVRHGYLHGNAVCNFVDIITAMYTEYKAKVNE